MKLIERQLVEGTDPPVYIGKREYTGKTGAKKVTTTYFCEYCIHGRPVQQGLKTPNKQLAIRRVHEIVSRIDRGEGHAVRARIEIPEIGRAYLEMQRGRNCAPTTYTKYKHTVVSWAAWSAVHFRRPAALFTEQHFWQWHQTLIDDGYSEKTRYDRAIIIKQVFKWAAKVRLIPSNPLSGCSLPEPTSTVQPCFTPDQVARLIAGADEHESAMYAVMAYAGLRFGEMRDLYWSAVAMPPDEPGFLTISRGGSNGAPKGRRTRRIPLHPELRKILETRPRTGERVFYSRPSRRFPDGDHRVGESHLLKSLKRLCRRIGFDNPDQYKLHTFRHAFASMCARNNVAYKYALEWWATARLKSSICTTPSSTTTPQRRSGRFSTGSGSRRQPEAERTRHPDSVYDSAVFRRWLMLRPLLPRGGHERIAFQTAIQSCPRCGASRRSE